MGRMRFMVYRCWQGFDPAVSSASGFKVEGSRIVIGHMVFRACR